MSIRGGALRYAADRPARSPAARVPRRFVGRFAGFRVFVVDGVALRRIFVDFTMGGSGERYDFVPKGEIWIDSANAACPEDGRATLIHEAVEAILMRDGGLSYNAAHDKASAVELQFRRRGGMRRL